MVARDQVGHQLKRIRVNWLLAFVPSTGQGAAADERLIRLTLATERHTESSDGN